MSMIKKIVILIIVTLLIIAIYTREKGDFTDRGISMIISVSQTTGDYLKHYKNSTVEKIKEFFEIKKEIIDEEIRTEKDKIQEDVMQKGRSVWDKIGDFIFRRE